VRGSKGAGIAVVAVVAAVDAVGTLSSSSRSTEDFRGVPITTTTAAADTNEAPRNDEESCRW